MRSHNSVCVWNGDRDCTYSVIIACRKWPKEYKGHGGQCRHKIIQIVAASHKINLNVKPVIKEAPDNRLTFIKYYSFGFRPDIG